MTGNGEGGDWAAPGASTPPPGWSRDQPPPSYPPPSAPPGWAPPPSAPPGWAPPPSPQSGWAQPPGSAGWTTYGPQQTPRGGIVPLRPLSVGEILDGAFTVIRRYPRTVLGLSAATAAVQQLLGLLVDVSTGGFASPTASGLTALGTVSGLVSAIINAVLATFLVGMLTLVVGDAVIGRKAPLRAVWDRLRPLMWRLLGASFLAAVLPWLGLVAVIIGGIVLWVALSFTTPALVLERLTVGQALRRSWRLAMASFWRVLGIRLLAWLIASVLGAILAIPGALIALAASSSSLGSGDIGLAAEMAIRVAAFLAGAITLPFTAGVTALLYIDCRMRTEALDVTLARAAAENAPA